MQVHIQKWMARVIILAIPKPERHSQDTAYMQNFILPVKTVTWLFYQDPLPQEVVGIWSSVSQVNVKVKIQDNEAHLK